jgi:hypothetical protein
LGTKPLAHGHLGDIKHSNYSNDVGKIIFSIKVFVTLLDYLKILQVAILDDLHV